MASLFDPSAFIEAERCDTSAETIATIAEPRRACETSVIAEKPQISAGFEMAPPEKSQQSQLSQPLGPEHSIWTSGPAQLAALPCPPGMKRSAWGQLVRLTKWVADDWAASAVEHGWHPLEFFGCHSDPSAGRRDHDGLVRTLTRMLTPVEVVAVHQNRIELLANRRDALSFRRSAIGGRVFLWDAYAMATGP